MFLNREDIHSALDSGLLAIENLTPASIQPASIDLRLSGHFVKMKNDGDTLAYSLKQIKSSKLFDTESGSVILAPGDFCLASTEEIVHLNAVKNQSLIGILKAKSSLARAGIFLPNAGWVDPGFHGALTIQLFNAGSKNVILQYGDPVVQMVLSLVTAPEELYHGGYNNSGGVRTVREGAF